MKELLFQYRMEVSFSDPVGDHSFTLKCIPESDDWQQIVLTKCDITPITWLSKGRDFFKNEYIYGKSIFIHNRFEVTVEGEALVDRNVTRKENISWDYMEYPTPLTTCSEDMMRWKSYYEKKLCEDPLHFKEHMYSLMDQIYQHMTYVSGSTDVNTSAIQAWEQKAGVCQDYAHIMLAICRSMKIPCLYIAGFMAGEGSSHAWVRLYDKNTRQIYDIDPTNHCWVSDEYIDVVKGKDAQDCKMNKGIYNGFAQETQKVTVIVKERGN